MNDHDHPRPALPAALLATAASLHAVGAHLPPPPVRRPWSLPHWIGDQEPTVAAMSLLHGAGVLACLYLAVLCAAHVLARRSRRPGLARLADSITVPAARRLLRAGLGVTLIGAPALADPGADPGVEPGVALMAPSRSVATMVPAPGRASTAPPSPWRTSLDQPPTPAPRAVAPRTWTVSAGESFWSIATELDELTGEPWTGAPPDVAERWRALIEINRARLVDPDDPDLLLPGQVLDVPPPGP